MRRRLDLNQPGTLLLKIIGLFLVVIPAVLYGTLRLLDRTKAAGILWTLIRVSFAIGILTCLVLFVLVMVEQIQDRYFDLQYQRNRAQKLPRANGNYECQYCGNQQVKGNDKICGICGKELKPAKSKLVK